MMVERRGGRRLMNQINVVPYIDVMLVLLVIFMVTAPLMNPGQVELPSVGKSAQPPVAPLEVIIRADKSLSLRDRERSGDERKVSRNELIAADPRPKQAKNPEQAVVISADKNVRYEAVLDVMDMLQQNQVEAHRAARTTEVSALNGQREPERALSGALSIAVHLVFLVMLLFTVTWQRKPPEPVSVDLWQDLPAPPGPKVLPAPPREEVRPPPRRHRPRRPRSSRSRRRRRRKRSRNPNPSPSPSPSRSPTSR